MQNDVESDLFLSAAHGNLENVEQLLLSGRVAVSLSLDVCREEFTGPVQGLLRAAVVDVLGPDSHVAEADVSIVSISDDLVGLGEGKGAGLEERDSCIAIALSIKASNGTGAEDIKQQMDQPSFLKGVGQFMGSKIRTIAWNPRLVTIPVAMKYSADDRDKIGCSAMHWAALNDRCDILEALVRHKADVNIKGNDGHTPLHWAALKGHLRAAQFLVHHGADLNSTDNWQFSPIIRASQNGHVLVVVLLLQEGADPVLVDDEGHNALHWAVYHKHHLVAHWLLREASVRAKVDMPDSKGCTALHLAARKSGREMMRKLLSVGAEHGVEDKEGNTPAKVAEVAKRAQNASYLQWYGRLPPFFQWCLTARGDNNRAYTVIPTFHGGLAMACILLAYVYWAIAVVPRTWGAVPSWNVALIVLTPPMWWCFWKSWKADPGTIHPQPEQVIKGICAEEISIEDVYVSAMSPKYPRAKYSRFFDCYVARFDHDCPWISNVVGAGNHAYFLGFCFLCALCLSVWSYIVCYMVGMTGYEYTSSKCGPRLGKGCPAQSDMIVFGLAHEKLAMVMIIIYALYSLFTWCMTFHQLRQIAVNVTTNEMINWHRYPGWQKEDGSFVNPYDRGMVYNFKQFFSGYPSCPRGANINIHDAKHGEMAKLLSKAGGEIAIEMGKVKGCDHCDHCEGDQMNDDVKKQLRDIGFDEA